MTYSINKRLDDQEFRPVQGMTEENQTTEVPYLGMTIAIVGSVLLAYVVISIAIKRMKYAERNKKLKMLSNISRASAGFTTEELHALEGKMNYEQYMNQRTSYF